MVPMNACHLLLGRPWQFDLDATHGGRSNNYSFVHMGVHHVLKPMPVRAIKAEVFATSKVKKKAATNATKPRTALLHEIQNDVTVASPKTVSVHSGSDSNTAARVFEDDQIRPFSKSELKCKACRENLSIQFGSFSHISRHDTLPKENMHAARKIEVLVVSIDNDSSRN